MNETILTLTAGAVLLLTLSATVLIVLKIEAMVNGLKRRKAADKFASELLGKRGKIK